MYGLAMIVIMSLSWHLSNIDEMTIVVSLEKTDLKFDDGLYKFTFLSFFQADNISS